MKIVVIEGDGLIGRKLVSKLRQRGHDVVAASPDTGFHTLTGKGLADALAGAMAVVDLASPPSLEDAAVMNFFETSTRNLVAAGQVAGVRHHLALSIVGTDRLCASRHFRAKVAQEKIIRAALVAYTVVRATPLFELAGTIADAHTEAHSVRLPPTLVQPIASGDVAESLAEIATQAALNRVTEIAGPASMGLDRFVGQCLHASGDARQVLVDPDAMYFGAVLDARSLMPGKSPGLGKTTLADWLGQPIEKRSQP